MKIHFDNVSFSSRTGPNTFATRLAKQFIVDGNDVVDDGSIADVSLVFIEASGAKLAPKVVQRLDGIWFKPEDFHQKKNAKIIESYQASDAVVFQSQFDSTMCQKWFGVKERSVVIRNGIAALPIKDPTKIAPGLMKIRSEYDWVFVCSANWHPQKRLKTNLEVFDHIRWVLGRKCCLIVLGANPDVYISDPHVYYAGSLPHEVCLQTFAIADWMIHMAWADHCPNTVVESLSQHTPVICSSVGGTKELIEGYGLVLDEPTYDFDLFDYDSPPDIDSLQIARLPNKQDLPLDFVKKIDMKHVAAAYIKTFEELI